MPTEVGIFDRSKYMIPCLSGSAAIYTKQAFRILAESLHCFSHRVRNILITWGNGGSESMIYGRPAACHNDVWL